MQIKMSFANQRNVYRFSVYGGITTELKPKTQAYSDARWDRQLKITSLHLTAVQSGRPTQVEIQDRRSCLDYRAYISTGLYTLVLVVKPNYGTELSLALRN